MGIAYTHVFQNIDNASVDAPTRCLYCGRTKERVQDKGYCPVKELHDASRILVGKLNPKAAARFEGRTCVTCHRPILKHWVRSNSDVYWCEETAGMPSEGIADTTFDVEGIAVPEEPTPKLIGGRQAPIGEN